MTTAAPQPIARSEIAPAKAGATARRRAARRGSGARWTDYLFVLPAVVFLLAFAAYPIVTTILYSFRKVTVPGLMTGILPFVGLSNYRLVLADPLFLHSVVISLIFTAASVCFQFVFGFAFALLFNSRFRLRGLFRGLVMLAWVMPQIVVGTVFKWMFQSGTGIINAALGAISPALPLAWLEQPGSALLAVILTNIWIGIPFNMAMLLAGLQGISLSVYEAARIDGASAWQRFRYVTLPLMRGPSLIVITLSIILTLNVFEIILIITGGGPGQATTVSTYYAYQQAFQFFKVGPASAVTVLSFCLLAVVSAVYLRLLFLGERGMSR